MVKIESKKLADVVFRKLPSIIYSLPTLAVTVLSIVCILTTTSCATIFGDNRVAWVNKARRSVRWSVEGTAGTPVIAGDTILYMGGYEPQDQVFLFAVDARTGENKWMSKKPIDQFLVEGDRVFVLSRPDFFKSGLVSDHRGSLMALSVKNGETLWSTDTQSKFQNPSILSIGKFIYYLSDKQTLMAVNKENGAVQWKIPQPFFPSSRSSSSVIAEGDDIYAEMPDHSIVWYDGTSGRFKDGLKLVSDNPDLQRHLSVSDHMLLIPGSDGTLVIANFRKHEVTDALDVGLITGMILVKDDVAYFVALKKEEHSISPQADKKLHRDALNEPGKKLPFNQSRPAPFACALNLKDKKLLWSSRLAGNGIGLPVIAEDLVLICSRGTDNNLVALDRKSGKELWKTNCGPLSGEPIYDRGTIYANGKERLYALQAKTGAVLWTLKPEEYGPAGSPVVKGDMLYTSADDSNLYAIRLQRRSPPNTL